MSVGSSPPWDRFCHNLGIFPWGDEASITILARVPEAPLRRSRTVLTAKTNNGKINKSSKVLVSEDFFDDMIYRVY